jgi:hypothetical protein
MNAPKNVAIALLALVATGFAHAEEVGQHPAVFAARSLPAVNPSTFIVGHPASPTTRGGHANFDHPAVVLARQQSAIDPNTFIVQPPVQVSWTVVPAATATLAQK